MAEVNFPGQHDAVKPKSCYTILSSVICNHLGNKPVVVARARSVFDRYGSSVFSFSKCALDLLNKMTCFAN